MSLWPRPTPRLRRLVAVSAAPISKMRDAKSGGGRIGIILNVRRYSPAVQEAVKARSAATFGSGFAGRHHRPAHRHVLQHRIATYVWILSNKKAPERKGKASLSTAATCAARCVNRWGQN